MKLKSKIAICMAVIVCFLAMASCSHEKAAQLANELHFKLNEISDLTISYDEESITFFESNNNEIIVKEYMTSDRGSYYAKVVEKNGSIHISEGGKPFFKDGFIRYVEVYLPPSYSKNLSVTTTDGSIVLSDISLELSYLRIDSTAGAIRINNAVAEDIHLSSTSGILDLGNIQANNIRLDTTSGNVICNELNGNVAYTSTSGNAEIKSAIGSGSYVANNSGELNVTYIEVTGDISLFNKNDSVVLTLPAELEFEFSATTKNGLISTNFQQSITSNGRTTSGTVGSNPTVCIKVETTNGNIEVTQ